MPPNCALKKKKRKAGPDTAQAETSSPVCPAQGSGGGGDTGIILDLNWLPGDPPPPFWLVIFLSFCQVVGYKGLHFN